MTKQELKTSLIKAFSNVPHPWRNEITWKDGKPQCEDYYGLIGAFGVSSWQELSPTIIDNHAEDLPLFHPDAYIYFLPAYLSRALDTPGSAVWEFTFYTIINNANPSDEDMQAWRSERHGMLTSEQVEVIIDYIEYTVSEFEELGKWLETEKVISKRLKFWKDILATKLALPEQGSIE